MGTTLQAASPRVAPEITATLRGRHFGLFGFNAEETARIAAVLRRVDAVGTRFEETWLGGSVRLGDALVIKLDAVGPSALREAAASAVPVLVAGSGESLLNGTAGAYGWPRDFLNESWPDAELLVRLFRLLAPARNGIAPAEPRSQPLILIADDDPAWLQLLEPTLRNHGLTCRTARDGLATLQLARQLVPDLLVLDVRMPGMDGFEVLETIRREPLLEQLPVTLLTGCDEDAEVSRGSELRADDYVVKPVSPTVLLNRIKRVLAATLPEAHRDQMPDEDPGPKAPGGVRSFFRLGQGTRPHEPEPALDALRTQYLENRVQELGVLAEALRRSDFPALRQAGHNLKGTGAAYGFAKLTEFGNALESAAKAEDGPEVELLLGKTKSYLSQIQTHAAH